MLPPSHCATIAQGREPPGHAPCSPIVFRKASAAAGRLNLTLSGSKSGLLTTLSTASCAAVGTPASNHAPAEHFAGELAADSHCKCPTVPCCPPPRHGMPKFTRWCVQVKESLKILGDFPRHVFADSSDDQPLAEVERAVADLTVGDLASGFDRHAVRSRDSATSRLTMIAPSRWREVGEHSRLWSTALQSRNCTVCSHTTYCAPLPCRRPHKLGGHLQGLQYYRQGGRQDWPTCYRSSYQWVLVRCSACKWHQGEAALH